MKALCVLTQSLIALAAFACTSVKALVEHAKANPGQLLYGSSGVGGVGHIPTEMLKRAAGNLDIVHVPYKGDNEVAQELVNERLSMAFATPGTTLPQIKAEKFRALAVTSKARSPALPDVPTTTEAGLPDFQISGWNAIFGPKDMPDDIQTALTGALDKALSNPDVAKKLTDLGTVIPNAEQRTPTGLAATLARDMKLLEAPLKASGVVIK